MTTRPPHSLVPQVLNMPHCHWRQFEEQCKLLSLQNEWRKVEQLQSGLWLCIQKNGNSGKNKGGKYPYDFIVIIYNDNNNHSYGMPSYTRSTSQDPRKHKGLIVDLYDKLQSDRAKGERLINLLFQVAREAEPHSLDLQAFQNLPGKPADEVLLTFKWLLAQEGVNYPIDRKLGGRLYPLYRIQEMKDGIDIQHVIKRCEAIGVGRPNPLPNVDYQYVDQLIKG